MLNLNPSICCFRVSSSKFLGSLVNAQGIKVNPEQIEALKLVTSPSTRKDMQSLNKKVATLSRFISRATDKCICPYDALKKDKGNFWTDKCEVAFH